jgi:hypothetical protein
MRSTTLPHDLFDRRNLILPNIAPPLAAAGVAPIKERVRAM